MLWPGHRLTENDAPLSVLRAFTLDEAWQLAERAGITARARLYSHFPFRLALVVDKTGAHG
jgi:hypothetical protein